MIKKFTSFTGLRICLLLMSWITSTALLAQTNYSEGPDFPGVAGAATYTLNQAGEYTFSGRIATPGDQQDAFKVIIPTGFKITRAVLSASGGNTQQQPTGFVSFADGTSSDYQPASFSSSSGVNVTRSGDLGPNSANNPYIGLASVDFSVGTTWSIKLTVVSTGTNVCIAPDLPAISATQTAICAGTTTSLSIQSGSLNNATAWKWYTGSCGGTLVGTGSSIQVSPTSTTTYYVRGEGGCVTAGACASQQITVNPQPNAPGVQNVAYCQGVPASPLTATGINLKYYTTASGGTPSTSVTPSTSNVGITNYYVSQTNANGCESPRAAINVTVNALPNAPGVQDVTSCQSAISSPLTANGTNLKYYTSATGGIGSVAAPTPPTSTPGTTTYYVSQTNVNGCESPRAAINFTVNPQPNAPGVQNVAYCQAAIPSPLTASGTNLKYYTSASGGAAFTSITPSTSNVGMTTYYVSQTNATGCESPRAAISVTINSLPEAPGIQNVAYCQGATPSALTATGTNLKYYTSSTGGTGSSTAPTPPTSTPGTTTYYVSQTNANGCESLRAAISVTINPLPNAPGVQNVAYCQGATPSALTATGTNLKYYTTASGGTPSTSITPSTSNVGMTTYYVSQTNDNGCESSRAAIIVTVNALPVVAITGLASAYCQDAGLITLSGTPANGSFTVDGTEASSFETANLTVGPHTVVYSYTNSNGCSSSISQTFTIKATPTAPTLVTAGGQPFPEGVSSLTASQNTGSVILSVSGCSDGTITWGGGDSKTLAVSTSNLGNQTFTATCTQNGCTSPAASFSLTIVPTTLSVLHLDVDNGQTQDQIIKPFLKLSNAGGQAIPYGELTVRYWFTSEGNAPPTDFQVYYAQLGAVSMKYVPLAQPRQGAFGYVEYSFPGGGSLPANGNSGPIETGILKSDRSNFNETDDYSYQLNRSYLPNARITAYRNGVIFWGQEPAAVAPQTAVQVYAATKDAAITSQIQTRLELRNTGNVSVPVSSLKLRYYFTSDNGQPTNVFVDYADMGASMVRAQVVRLSSPVNGADSYVELSFPESTRRLSPLSSLGFIDFRLVRSDFGLLNQNNDYSFAPVYGSVRLNSRITAYLENQLIFGMVPSDASARVAAGPVQEVGVTGLQVQVLGNPVVGNNVEVAISGVARQSLRLTLVDLQGRVIGEQRIGQASENERVSLPLGNSRGHLLLKVNTDTQQQSLRLVRP